MSVNLVIIWADKDRSGAGQNAAKRLGRSLNAKGVQTRIMLPPGDIGDGKGVDWLDVLNRHGDSAFFEMRAELSGGVVTHIKENTIAMIEEAAA